MTGPEYIHLRQAASDARCEVCDWPTEGLGKRLVQTMRERHGKGGINVCVDCVERARDDAARKVAP